MANAQKKSRLTSASTCFGAVKSIELTHSFTREKKYIIGQWDVEWIERDSIENGYLLWIKPDSKTDKRYREAELRTQGLNLVLNVTCNKPRDLIYYFMPDFIRYLRECQKQGLDIETTKQVLRKECCHIS